MVVETRLALPGPLASYSIEPGNPFISCRLSERYFLLVGELKDQILVSLRFHNKKNPI